MEEVIIVGSSLTFLAVAQHVPPCVSHVGPVGVDDENAGIGLQQQIQFRVIGVELDEGLARDSIELVGQAVDVDALARPVLDSLLGISVDAIGDHDKALILVELFFLERLVQSEILAVAVFQGAIQPLLTAYHLFQLLIGVAAEFLSVAHDLQQILGAGPPALQLEDKQRAAAIESEDIRLLLELTLLSQQHELLLRDELYKM